MHRDRFLSALSGSANKKYSYLFRFRYICCQTQPISTIYCLFEYLIKCHKPLKIGINLDNHNNFNAQMYFCKILHIYESKWWEKIIPKGNHGCEIFLKNIKYTHYLHKNSSKTSQGTPNCYCSYILGISCSIYTRGRKRNSAIWFFSRKLYIHFHILTPKTLINNAYCSARVDLYPVSLVCFRGYCDRLPSAQKKLQWDTYIWKKAS